MLKLIEHVVNYFGYLLQNLILVLISWLVIAGLINTLIDPFDGAFLFSIFILGFLTIFGYSKEKWEAEAIAVEEAYKKEIEDEQHKLKQKLLAQEQEEIARKQEVIELEREEKEKAARQKIATLEKIKNPAVRANKNVIAEFSSNKYLTNQFWELDERIGLIRKYGFQRFMFSTHKPVKENLASKLSIEAKEAILAEQLEQLGPIVSMVPIIEVWLQDHAVEWLHELASKGEQLPQKISISDMAQDIGLEISFRRRSARALKTLFECGFLLETSNADKVTQVNIFLYELFNTPKINKLKKQFLNDGIQITFIHDPEYKYLSSEAFLSFENR